MRSGGGREFRPIRGYLSLGRSQLEQISRSERLCPAVILADALGFPSPLLLTALELDSFAAAGAFSPLDGTPLDFSPAELFASSLLLVPVASLALDPASFADSSFRIL